MSCGSSMLRPIAALGVISYSLYLIHQFNLNLVGAVARYCLPSETPQPWVNATIVALHLVLASAFWYCCERPFLRQRGERRGNSVSKATSLGLPQS